MNVIKVILVDKIVKFNIICLYLKISELIHVLIFRLIYVFVKELNLIKNIKKVYLNYKIFFLKLIKIKKLSVILIYFQKIV